MDEGPKDIPKAASQSGPPLVFNQNTRLRHRPIVPG